MRHNQVNMRRILVRVPQWLGDAVVSTVFLTRLKTLHSEASLSVLTVPHLAPLFETHPAVDKVLLLPYPKGSIWDAIGIMKPERFDAVYILPRSFRTILEARGAGIPRRFGFGGGLRRLFLTDSVTADDNLPYARRYLKLIGEEMMDLETTPPLFPSKKPSRLNVDGFKRPFLGMAPVSIAPSRTWAPDRFAQLADLVLEKKGGTVILFGSASEREAVENVRKKMRGPAINTAGELDIPELGWFVSQLELLLANDSGIMHVASCFKIPSAIIFGASDPRTALPAWGRFLSIQNTNISCVPCGRNTCPRFGPYYKECLESVSVNMVDDALHGLA